METKTQKKGSKGVLSESAQKMMFYIRALLVNRVKQLRPNKLFRV